MHTPPLRRTLLLALGACLAHAAWAQQTPYKVVAPDGKVTYTDRPPADGSLSVTELGRSAPPGPGAGSTLPADLQRLSARFPVTLFTTGECPPCDGGRALLQQRGVPYNERQVLSNDDIAALERTVGGRTLPALTVGGQALRGFSADDWTSYLDAAGYPRESRLPRGWAPPAATPLVTRTPAQPRPPETVAEAPAAETAPVAPPPPASGAIRF